MVKATNGRIYFNEKAGTYSTNFSKSLIEDTSCIVRGNCPVIQTNVPDGILITPDYNAERREGIFSNQEKKRVTLDG